MITKQLKLLGCIVHIGSSSTSGHYVYYEFHNDFCILKNDSVITKINNTNIPDEIATDGYVFLYEIIEST